MGRRKEGRKEQRERGMDPTAQKPVPNTLRTRAWLPPAMPRTTYVPQLSTPQGWVNQRQVHYSIGSL